VFIALRDLAYAKGRFALVGLVVALVAYCRLQHLEPELAAH